MIRLTPIPCVFEVFWIIMARSTFGSAPDAL